MAELSTLQQQVLDYVAQENNTMQGGVSWKRLWARFASEGEEQLKEAIAFLLPQYITYHTAPPNTAYKATLEGIFASSLNSKATKWLSAILGLLRRMFQANPDFREYTWEQVRNESSVVGFAPRPTANNKHLLCQDQNSWHAAI